MTGLRLTVLLGPSATVEAAELKMGALPHTLAMAVPFDGWNEAAGGNVLPVAMAKVAEMFAAGIKRGEHLAEPADEPSDLERMLDTLPQEPGAVVSIGDAAAACVGGEDEYEYEYGSVQGEPGIVCQRVPKKKRGEAAEPPPDQPASPEPVVHASAGPLYDAVLRELLSEETWAEVYEAMDKARRIVALVERRAA